MSLIDLDLDLCLVFGPVSIRLRSAAVTNCPPVGLELIYAILAHFFNSQCIYFCVCVCVSVLCVSMCTSVCVCDLADLRVS